MAKSDGDGGDPQGGFPGTQTLMRGLDILDSAMDGPVKVSDLAKKLELTRSTAHRLAQALHSRDYLALTAEGYTLGPKLLLLGSLAHEHTDYTRIARPYMERLSQDTGYCVFVGKREGNWSRHLDRVTGRHRLRVSTSPGDQRYISETGLGKALLLDESDEELVKLFRASQPSASKIARAEWLQQISDAKRRHIVLHDSPAGDGVRSVAAPVRDAHGKIVMAVSIAGASLYLTDDVMEGLVGPVKSTADAISLALGYSPSAPHRDRKLEHSA